ncbi:MAG: gephyrin-like molybdotransferase Glp [Pseudomonadota bacterium]
MAQLSDDCFAFGGKLLAVDDALATVSQRLDCLVGTEPVKLSEALDRVLAAPVVAPRDVPPHNNSAVDGYAVRFADLTQGQETRLPIDGRLQAGDPATVSPRAATALRVFTGAAMPPGPDTIFMQEDCRDKDGIVVLPAGIKKGANYRFAGEDVRRGETVLEPGTRLGPANLGLVASLGTDRLDVREQLKVAILSTGNELLEPGAAARTGAVYDANRYTIGGLLRRAGYAVTDAGILPDRPEQVSTALDRLSRDHHAIIASGGVSTGDADYVKDAVEVVGGRLHAWRLAIKPGRPVALGQIGDCAFIGLPGNPVAVVVTYQILARPLLAKLAGRSLPPVPAHPVIADFDYRKKPGRREYLRVSLAEGDGLPCARRFPRDGAGILSSVVNSDGLLVLDESIQGVQAGDRLPFVPWTAFD